MQRMSLWVPVLVLLVVLSAGCGEKASETATEQMIESAMGAQGQNVDVNIDSGTDTMQITSKDGSMSFGEGTKLPSGWPEDVPVYKGLTLQSAMSTGDGFSIQGTTSDAQEKVRAFYKEQAEKNGWSEDTTITQPQMVMVNYTKENRGMTVMISAQDSETAVSLTVANE